MDIIIQPNQDTIRQIGGPQYKVLGRKYRLNKYCLQKEVENGTLIFNSMTGALIHIKPYELINIFTDDPCDYVDFLVNAYFIVPEDFDEKSLVDLIRSRQSLPITSTYLDNPSHFTILSTTTCNARCFYCYELKAKGKTPMSKETAEKVAKYIISRAPKNKEIELDWFGGEPLYNQEVIDIITSRIASAGFNYRGSMISNGYLMGAKTAQKAKDFWRLTNIQITLDGTQDIYNKTKNYIYKDDPNPFQTVIDNIHALLDTGILVSIRMNCDTHNCDDLKELTKFLIEEFKGKKNFSMYVWPIFEEGFKRSEEDQKKVYDSIDEIENIILEGGYPLSHRISNQIKGIHCMVDGGNGVIISPNGDLGLCEHYINSRFFSHIDNPLEKDFDEIRSWRNYGDGGQHCNDCPIYPICLKMKDCPDDFECEDIIYKHWINHTEKDMEYTYKEYLQGKIPSCQNNNCCNQHKISVFEKIITHTDGTVEHIPVNNDDNIQS